MIIHIVIVLLLSTNGCRSVITHVDGQTQSFYILDEFKLNFAQRDDNNLWLDYVLVIPEQSFSPEIMSQMPIDKTEEFIAKLVLYRLT